MQLYYETPDGRAKLYLGDARNLDLIEDESIDMIATSPPYWGKRDYGEEVVAIWGGEDGCEHEWDAYKGQLRVDSPWGEGGEGRLKKYDKNVEAKGERAYCSLCGAWRGQLGLEPAWQEYIAHLCECAEEWWRVLKPTGNLFVNMGDTFAGGTGASGFSDKSTLAGYTSENVKGRIYDSTFQRRQVSIPKMKLGIPHRLRFALNDMGWVSRDDIIWYKGKEYPDGRISKTAMPESVKGRFACSYEMVLRFVKTPKMNYYVNEKTLESRDRPPKERIEGRDFEWRIHEECEGKGCKKRRCKDGKVKYSFWHGVDQWFDLDAVRTPAKAESIARYQRGVNLVERTGAAMTPANKFWDKEDLERHGGAGTLRGRSYKDQGYREQGKAVWGGNQMSRSLSQIYGEMDGLKGGNPGDVWIIQPEPFSAKHYAVWPSELCERMIKVGCPREVCPKCGKPRERITTVDYEVLRKSKITDQPKVAGQQETSLGARNEGFRFAVGKAHHRTIGWSDCGCGEGWVPGVCLDPFGGGSGRLQERALFLGRNAIMVDMKREYLEMAKKPLLQGVLL